MPESKGPKKSFMQGIRLAERNLPSNQSIILITTRETVDNSNIMSKMQMQEKFGRDYDERQFKEAATRCSIVIKVNYKVY